MLELLTSISEGAWEYLWRIFVVILMCLRPCDYVLLNPLRSCDLTVRKLTRDSQKCQGGADKFF